MYGYIAKVSVLAPALCICSSPHERQSVADNSMFRRHIEWHVRGLTRNGQEQNIEDSGVLQSAFPTL